MIRIQQLKFPLEHSAQDIQNRIKNELMLNTEQHINYKIFKKSIDARKKNDIKIVYTIDIITDDEKTILDKINNKKFMLTKKQEYCFPSKKTDLNHNPVIIGSGPAGLFCALMLAEQGYAPIVLERGMDVDKRVEDVNNFWTDNRLNTESNVQFGEGGAGTFSDGKLNTMVKDKFFRNRKVLEEFVEAGAPSDILYLNKPHIGTDYLRTVVKNIRKKIIALGGKVLFDHKATSFIMEDNAVVGVEVNNKKIINTHSVVLALGHSARDTFKVLTELGVTIEKKAFAIGLRIEHPQEIINKSQYGKSHRHPNLPVADYKLTHRCKNERGVYSFCMCPGGFVVNASSEENRVVTNGMSNFARSEMNANSALLVNVTPDDFSGDDVLAGVEFQRKWENLAFVAGGSNYNIPIQLAGDFLNNKISTGLGNVSPSLGSKVKLANLNECLPHYVSEAIKEGINKFDNRISGFGKYDAILSGVETRSSSPIRIVRNEDFESNIRGLYPCGEGAGYAGGIMSAAMDGIKVAEAVVKNN